MGKEAQTGFNFEQATLLGIEPIEPGKTFRLIRAINRWDAEQILGMHPRSSPWLKMPRIGGVGLRDFAEISAHTLTLASASALGISLILTPPAIILEILSSFSSGRSPQLAEIITLWGGFTATLGGLSGLYGGSYEAIHQPDARFFRFGKSC